MKPPGLKKKKCKSKFGQKLYPCHKIKKQMTSEFHSDRISVALRCPNGLALISNGFL